nr:hypothetical protein GCM10020185_34540 [Pseudomonas brassicacearum subsp. brassicacearum]
MFFDGGELFRQAAERIDLFIQPDHASLIHGVAQALEGHRGVVDNTVNFHPAFRHRLDAFKRQAEVAVHIHLDKSQIVTFVDRHLCAVLTDKLKAFAPHLLEPGKKRVSM